MNGQYESGHLLLFSRIASPPHWLDSMLQRMYKVHCVCLWWASIMKNLD